MQPGTYHPSRFAALQSQQLIHSDWLQVATPAWEPLTTLRTLSLSLPRSLSRDSADDILRACKSLRTLRLQYPGGSVDTSYLARHAERCTSLQLLDITAQRMLFNSTFSGAGSVGAGKQGHQLHSGGVLALFSTFSNMLCDFKCTAVTTEGAALWRLGAANSSRVPSRR